MTRPAASPDAITEKTTDALDEYAGRISAIAEAVYGAGHPEAADALAQAARIIVGASARILSDLGARLPATSADLIQDQGP